MANWDDPKLEALYSDFLLYLKARDIDTATLFTTDPVNPPVGAIRYVRASNKFQEWNGTAWVDKIISVAGGGTGSNTPAGAGSALGLGTMSTQNANSVAISGGTISGLNSLQSNGEINSSSHVRAAVDVTAGQNLGVAGTAFVGAIQCAGGINSGGITAAGINAQSLALSGNLACARIDASQLILTYADLYARGVLRAGPGDIPITNGADGTLLAGRIGYGYTGSGTRVLLDNNTWGVLNVSSFITSIVNDMSFGSGEDFKDINISGLGLANIDELMFMFHGPTTILDMGGYQWSVAPMKPFNTSVIRIQKYPLGGTNAAALGPSTHSFAAYRIRLG